MKGPWFAYVMLMALQLKVVWQIWRFKDFTLGDTSWYFHYASYWMEFRLVNIVWSPLYTAYYGAVVETVGDAYAGTIIHRVLIALAACVLVLAVMRRLLPAALAWLIAAWWTVLPVNYDTTYEIHLFALVPILLTWLAVAAWPGPWGRGLGLGIMAGATVLIRNEFVISWVLLGFVCLVYDVGRVRAGRAPRGQTILAYVVPLAAAIVLCTMFYARSVIQFPELWQGYGPKHTMNMCQAFASGYGQRHPEWTGHRMTECAEVMVRNFGETSPSLVRMFTSNPFAVLEHFWWNLKLTPSGMQLLLFNATSGDENPDFLPVRTGSQVILVLSLLTVAVTVAGLCLLYRDRRAWWSGWLRSRAGIWVFVIGMIVPHAVLVIVTQRPRPSYLFEVGVGLMALVAMCAWALVRARPRRGSVEELAWWRARSKLAIPGLMILLIVVVPRHYDDAPAGNPRLLLQTYRRLAPFAPLIARGDAVVLVNAFPMELSNYIGWNRPRTIEYSQVGLPSDANLIALLDEQRVNLFYVDETLLGRSRRPALFVDMLEATRDAGWHLLGFEEGRQARWRLWGRSTFLTAGGGS